MVEFSRLDDMRQHNRQRVLSALRREKIASRTDISARTGLSAATVSAITSDLLNEGILIQFEPELDANPDRSGPGRGRPKVSLGFNPSAGMVCAVYFQFNCISASTFDYAGNVMGECTVETPGEIGSADEIRNSLISIVEKVLERTSCQQVQLQHIELGVQGVTDVAGTKVLWTPICAQTNIPVKQWLESHFHVATHVANDCDLIAQALNWRDPQKYGENFAAVLLAHGVGMGLFLRGGIINGTRSSGVEFGHMTYVPDGARCRCGNRGCIEAYAGDYAIRRRAAGQDGNTAPSRVLESTDLAAVLKAARAGDGNAREAIDTAGAAIGTGLASLFAIVDAFPVVLVGRGATLIELMEPAIRAALETAPGEKLNSPLQIESFNEEGPLVREGCAIRALLALDEEVARQRNANEAAE